MNFSELKTKYNFSKIPDNLNISTISICCSFNTIVNLKNIFDYFKLDTLNINTIKYKNIVNTVLPKVNKKKEKNRKKEKNEFFNQLTMLIYSEHSKKNINLKLFQNGSIQMWLCFY